MSARKPTSITAVMSFLHFHWWESSAEFHCVSIYIWITQTIYIKKRQIIKSYFIFYHTPGKKKKELLVWQNCIAVDKFKQTIYSVLGLWIFPLALDYWHSSVIVSLLISTIALSIMKFGFPLDTQPFTSTFKLQMSRFFLCCTFHSVFWLFSSCLKLKQLPG